MLRLLPLLLCACGRLAFEPVEAELCAVAFDGAGRMNFHSVRSFTATGGLPPYAYSTTALATLATLDPVSGVVTTYDQPGEIELDATDALGCTARAMIPVGGATLWYVGGSSNAVPSRDVFSSADGLTWNRVGMLPGPRQYGALLVYRDRLWWISGSPDGTAFSRDVFVSTNGVDWTSAGQVPVGATSFGHTVFAGRMWMVGGNNNTDKVVSTDDGANWRSDGALPMQNHGGSLGVLGNRMYYAGGHNGSLFDWVLASDTGASWQQVGTLAQGREYHSTITLDSGLWIIGGQDTTPTSLTSVVHTTTGSAFAAGTALPAGRAFGAIARFGERLWSVGGTDGGVVWSASLDGVWRIESANLPLPRQGGGLVAFSPSD